MAEWKLYTRPLTLLLLAACLAGTPTEAGAAMPGNKGFGPRLGLSVDPDQIVVGVHASLGQLAPHVRFQPNVELGFGDDVTLVEINADVHYRFQNNWDVWNPYAGAGLGLGFAAVDGADDQSDLQVHLVGGVEKGVSNGAFFGEIKFGLSDETPDFKFLVGWTFRRM